MSTGLGCGCGSAAAVRFAIVTVESGVELEREGPFLGCADPKCQRRNRAQRKAENRAALMIPSGSAEARLVTMERASAKQRASERRATP